MRHGHAIQPEAHIRLVVRANNPLEWVLLRLGLVPLPLLDSYWGMAIARSVITGVQLGVFDALHDRPLTAEELAERLQTDPLGTQVLLGALNGARYVTRRNGRYSNGRAARRWLADGSLVHLRESVLFFDDLWDAMSELTDMVRSGLVENLHYQDRPAEFWQRYLRGLAAFVPLVAPEIARKTGLPKDARRLLDVGGGHGLYAGAFVSRHPDMTAEVLDLASACAVGREVVEQAGLRDRVVFREGDMRTAEWGEDYDGVLLFNLIHNLTEDESRAAFRSAAQSLRPGGKIVVLDSEYQGGGGNISLTAGLNEMMFYLTSGTRVYPEALIRQWLKEAGFSEIRTQHLTGMPMMTLITAVR